MPILTSYEILFAQRSHILGEEYCEMWHAHTFFLVHVDFH